MYYIKNAYIKYVKFYYKLKNTLQLQQVITFIESLSVSMYSYKNAKKLYTRA